MSKKKNKKFKKSNSNNGTKTNIGISKPRIVVAQADSQPERAIEETAAPEPVKLDPYEELDLKYRNVRGEVNKILAILVVLIVVLTGAHFLRTKTTALDFVGDFLYKAANIQTQ